MLEDYCDSIIFAFHKNKGSKSDFGNNNGILFLSVARSLPAFAWTDWSRSPKEVSQRRSVASDRRAAAPWTWYLVSGRSGEGHWTEQGPLLCLYRFHKGLWYSQQGGPLDGLGEIRLTKEVCDADPAASRQNDRTGSLQRRPNSCLRKCSEAGLAPDLFNLFSTCMLADAVQDMADIRYHLDWSLFDLQSLNAKTKCWHQLIQEALFADDCALLAHKYSNLQINKSRRRRRPSGWLSASARPRYCTRLLQTPPVGPNISTYDTPLTNVDSFKYLGSIISNDGNHIQDQQSKPSAKIRGTEVHNHHNIRFSTKLVVHRAVDFTSLLYGCEICMSNSWSTFTCVLSIPYLASSVKTLSQTQRSWTVKIVPVLSPYSSRPSCDGWDVRQVGRPSHAPSTAVWRAWGRQEKEKLPAEAVQGHCQGELSVVQHLVERTWGWS